MNKLKAIEAAAKKATKGPWEVRRVGEWVAYICQRSAPWSFVNVLRDKLNICRVNFDTVEQMQADAEFIALTDPDTILELVAYIRNQDAEHAEVQSARAFNENLLLAENRELREWYDSVMEHGVAKDCYYKCRNCGGPHAKDLCCGWCGSRCPQEDNPEPPEALHPTAPKDDEA